MIDLSVSDVTFRKFVEFSFLSPIPANKNPVTVSSSPIIPINMLFSLRLNLLFFDIFFYLFNFFYLFYFFIHFLFIIYLFLFINFGKF